MMGLRAFAICAGVALLAVLAACAQAVPTATQSERAPLASVAGGSWYVFVTNDRPGSGHSPSEVDYWPAGSSGNVAPAGVISGANTRLSSALQGIVVDSKGEIYVANAAANNILGFAPLAKGDVAPNLTIAGSKTGLTWPDGLALDAEGNLYVANCGTVCGGPAAPPSIEEFPNRSNGNVKPTRTIVGLKANFVKPHGIAVATNGAIYLADNGENGHHMSIDVFAPGANGNVAPIRVIAGKKTGLPPAAGGGMAIDSNGIYTGSWARPEIERFASKANGDVRPIAVIEGPHTDLQCCLDGTIIGPGNTIYAVDRGTGSEKPEILEFTSLASGDIGPITNLTGPTTRLDVPLFVFVAKQRQ